MEDDSTNTERAKGGHSLPRLVRCDSCDEIFHPDDLNTVDVEEYGKHNTIEVCDGCMTTPIPVKITDADIDATHWIESHGTPDEGGC